MTLWQIVLTWLKWTTIWGLACVGILALGLLIVHFFGSRVGVSLGVLVVLMFLVGAIVAVPITKARIQERRHNQR